MKEMYHEIEDCVQGMNLMVLSRFLQRVCKCSEKPVILMIDEVDSASNNQVFLDFLAQLRSYYLQRDTKGIVTFQSVILAGVFRQIVFLIRCFIIIFFPRRSFGLRICIKLPCWIKICLFVTGI